MKLGDKIIVITGGGSGIGRAMAQRFSAEKPRRIIVSDINADSARAVAAEIGGVARPCDVSREAEVRALIEETEASDGPIDLFCGNAGIAVVGGVELPDDAWQRSWNINVMAHVWAARVLVPRMLARGGGYLLSTASAAGLLSMVGAAAYTATKHAVVALCESLSIEYGARGLRVSCLAPLFVQTPMLDTALAAASATVAASGAVLTPEAVAEAVVAGLDAERFFILPHPDVAAFVQRKTADPERWLARMRQLVDNK
jgi:NAD(P)-dependent dehydrogenase (short-subunit alcohol dehydrogenase family)